MLSDSLISLQCMMTRDALCRWTRAAGAGRWTLNLSVAARLDMTYQTLVCSLGMKDVEPATPHSPCEVCILSLNIHCYPGLSQLTCWRYSQPTHQSHGTLGATVTAHCFSVHERNEPQWVILGVKSTNVNFMQPMCLQVT